MSVFWLLLGASCFVLAYISDVLWLKNVRRKWCTLLFFLGNVCLAVATAGLLLFSFQQLILQGLTLKSAAVLLLMLFDLGLLFYTLFFALPFSGAYGQEEGAVTAHGMYALCRHPGVLWLALFYLLGFFLAQDFWLLLAFFVFGGLDTAYVVWQDRVLFPKKLAGYKAYQTTVPFLIPTGASLRRALPRKLSRYKGQ